MINGAVGWGSSFLGLLGGRAQWLFDCGATMAGGHRVASVTSGARFWDDADDESFARNLKGLLQKYDRLFDKPLPYVMAMHQKPPRRQSRHHHFHIEFYPPNRTRDKLKAFSAS